MAQKDLDVVLYGASGFVGKLTAAYLNEHAPEGARIALAGRSAQRLEEVRGRLGGRAADWPLLVADSADRAALDDIARRTTVVATTVGPYARYGRPLVTACAENGTHYADLTGEVLFMRRTIDELDDPARSTGARIVHSTGFDSIPSDLGVLLLHEAVRRDGAGELEETTLVVTGAKGGVSGGTIASTMTQLEDMRGDAAARRQLADAYSLSPQRDKEPDRVDDGWRREGDFDRPRLDALTGHWLAPFVMATVNTRVVRRSNALQDWAYGHRFRYREAMGMGAGPLGVLKAGGLTAGLAAGMATLATGPGRRLAGRFLPAPGEGPSERTRNEGFFRMEVHGRTSTRGHYVSHVAAQGDPGYAATAVMFGESALCLAFDGGRLPDRAGVLTPATAMGLPLVDRLRARGFTMDAARS
jgi:short subunit dehydrogenase-like uncharacterized protein